MPLDHNFLIIGGVMRLQTKHYLHSEAHNQPKATTDCIVDYCPGCWFNTMRAGGSFLLFIIH